MKLNNVSEKNELKINLSYRGLNPRKIWRRLVEAQMRKLQDLAAILSARITLERQREVTPGFRVFVTLEVPGPDFHAEARDYTLQAALLKVIDNLRRQMQSRKNRQLVHARTAQGGPVAWPDAVCVECGKSCGKGVQPAGEFERMKTRSSGHESCEENAVSGLMNGVPADNPFPLTPTLSLGEREKTEDRFRVPMRVKTNPIAGVCQLPPLLHWRRGRAPWGSRFRSCNGRSRMR